MNRNIHKLTKAFDACKTNLSNLKAENKIYIKCGIFQKINCFYTVFAERKDIPSLKV